MKNAWPPLAQPPFATIFDPASVPSTAPAALLVLLGWTCAVDEAIEAGANAQLPSAAAREATLSPDELQAIFERLRENNLNYRRVLAMEVSPVALCGHEYH